MTFQRTPDVKAGGGEHIVRLLTQYRFCVKENDHPPTHGTNSILQASFHTPPLIANSINPCDKIKTWSSLDVTSGVGKCD